MYKIKIFLAIFLIFNLISPLNGEVKKEKVINVTGGGL
jgi:hypothetical protein